ncbi:hypothetical protein BB558_000299 [Smittium angustum]|uniref:BRCT domain-containing protein n=1 Tax=Smittium angustum TaxID=133377 RepID=A0A2U1JES3_SMIAN|nr:hypothetical protein BB558_000299 [Smittium angustum]
MQRNDNIHPDFSNGPLSGKIFCCSGIEKPERNSLFNRIRALGGHCEEVLTKNVNVLISNCSKESEKCKVAAIAGIPIVTTKFVDDFEVSYRSLKRKSSSRKSNIFLSSDDNINSVFQLACEKNFKEILEKNILGPFVNCSVCVTGMSISERNEIKLIIEAGGGEYRPNLTKDCGYLIAHKPEGSKYEYARIWDINIVNLKWIEDCFKLGVCLDELEYRICPKTDESLSSRSTTRESVHDSTNENRNRTSSLEPENYPKNVNEKDPKPNQSLFTNNTLSLKKSDNTNGQPIDIDTIEKTDIGVIVYIDKKETDINIYNNTNNIYNTERGNNVKIFESITIIFKFSDFSKMIVSKWKESINSCGGMVLDLKFDHYNDIIDKLKNSSDKIYIILKSGLSKSDLHLYGDYIHYLQTNLGIRKEIYVLFDTWLIRTIRMRKLVEASPHKVDINSLFESNQKILTETTKDNIYPEFNKNSDIEDDLIFQHEESEFLDPSKLEMIKKYKNNTSNKNSNHQNFPLQNQNEEKVCDPKDRITSSKFMDLNTSEYESDLSTISRNQTNKNAFKSSEIRAITPSTHPESFDKSVSDLRTKVGNIFRGFLMVSVGWPEPEEILITSLVERQSGIIMTLGNGLRKLLNKLSKLGDSDPTKCTNSENSPTESTEIGDSYQKVHKIANLVQKRYEEYGSRYLYIVAPLRGFDGFSKFKNTWDEWSKQNKAHVTPMWVTECWLERCIDSNKTFQHSISNDTSTKEGLGDSETYMPEKILFHPLENKRMAFSNKKWIFSISGYEGLERDHIGRLCECMGIEFRETFNKKTTHLICKPPFSGQKYRRALKWKTPVVGADPLYQLASYNYIPACFLKAEDEKNDLNDQEKNIENMIQKSISKTEIITKNLELSPRLKSVSPNMLHGIHNISINDKELESDQNQQNLSNNEHNSPKGGATSMLPAIPFFSPIYKIDGRSDLIDSINCNLDFAITNDYHIENVDKVSVNSQKSISKNEKRNAGRDYERKIKDLHNPDNNNTGDEKTISIESKSVNINTTTLKIRHINEIADDSKTSPNNNINKAEIVINAESYKKNINLSEEMNNSLSSKEISLFYTPKNIEKNPPINTRISMRKSNGLKNLPDASSIVKSRTGMPQPTITPMVSENIDCQYNLATSASKNQKTKLNLDIKVVNLDASENDDDMEIREDFYGYKDGMTSVSKLANPLVGQQSLVGSMLFCTPGMTPLGAALERRLDEALGNAEKGYLTFEPPPSVSFNISNNNINYLKHGKGSDIKNDIQALLDLETPTKINTNKIDQTEGTENMLFGSGKSLENNSKNGKRSDKNVTSVSGMNMEISESNAKRELENKKKMILKGITICVSSRLTSTRDELHKIAIQLGANVVSSSLAVSKSGISSGTNPLATHLIHASSKERDHLRDVRWAKINGVHIVSPYWLYSCDQLCVRVDEGAFGPTYQPDKLLLVPSSFSNQNNVSLNSINKPVNTNESFLDVSQPWKTRRTNPYNSHDNANRELSSISELKKSSTLPKRASETDFSDLMKGRNPKKSRHSAPSKSQDRQDDEFLLVQDVKVIQNDTQNEVEVSGQASDGENRFITQPSYSDINELENVDYNPSELSHSPKDIIKKVKTTNVKKTDLVNVGNVKGLGNKNEYIDQHKKIDDRGNEDVGITAQDIQTPNVLNNNSNFFYGSFGESGNIFDTESMLGGWLGKYQDSPVSGINLSVLDTSLKNDSGNMNTRTPSINKKDNSAIIKNQHQGYYKRWSNLQTPSQAGGVSYEDPEAALEREKLLKSFL